MLYYNPKTSPGKNHHNLKFFERAAQICFPKSNFERRVFEKSTLLYLNETFANCFNCGTYLLVKLSKVLNLFKQAIGQVSTIFKITNYSDSWYIFLIMVLIINICIHMWKLSNAFGFYSFQIGDWPSAQNNSAEESVGRSQRLAKRMLRDPTHLRGTAAFQNGALSHL